MGKLVILSPHLDDAVLSAWHHIEQPGSHVITLFAGVPETKKTFWWDRLSGLADGRSAMLARRQENAAALKPAAVHVTNLDYLDRQYDPPKRNIAQMADDIEAISQNAKYFLVNAGVGSLFIHPDHVTSRQVGLELYRRGRQVSFYLDLPYSAVLRRLSDWPERLPISKIEQALGAGIRLERHTLSPAEALRKQTAINAYRSQRRSLKLTSLGAMSSRILYAPEVTVRLAAPTKT